MKLSRWFIGILLTAVACGCAAEPRPAAGLAGVVVNVIAQPKIGTAAAPARLSVYDNGSGTGGGVGDFERVDYSDLRDIVVWLESIKAASTAHAPGAAAQVALSFPPAASSPLAVASVGQAIVFQNSGSQPLNAYSVSDGNEFNLGTIPAGGRARATAKTAGLIEIVSDAAAEPLARVYVAASPWVALAKSGAAVNFNDVPPGQYRLVSWHPRLPGTMVELNLLPNEVKRSSIDVGVNHLPKVDSN